MPSSADPLRLALPPGHTLEGTRYTFIVRLVVSERGDVERFQVLVGPDDEAAVAAIRTILKTWHYPPCVIQNEARAFYRTAKLVYEPT